MSSEITGESLKRGESWYVRSAGIDPVRPNSLRATGDIVDRSAAQTSYEKQREANRWLESAPPSVREIMYRFEEKVSPKITHVGFFVAMYALSTISLLYSIRGIRRNAGEGPWNHLALAVTGYILGAILLAAGLSEEESR